MERRTNKLESKERLSSRRILLVDFVGSHYSVLRVCASHRTTGTTLAVRVGRQN